MLNYEKLNKLNKKMFEVLNDEKVPEKIKVQKIEDLLDKGADVNAREDNYKRSRTPLLVAAYNGDKEVVKILLLKGADIEAEDYTEETALLAAAYKGHKEVVELLLDNGAYIDKTSKWGSALVEASENGHKEIVELLIKRNADKERKNGNDETALMRAAYKGHKDIVELLIDNGVLLDEKNKVEETAFMLAIWEGHKDVAELLIDRGASIDDEDKFGNTAWNLANKAGHKEIADFLLEKGVKKQGTKYRENGSFKAVSELAEALGKINEKPKVNSDRADLISMVKKGDVKQVKKLIDLGVDVTKKDKFGKSALDYAYEKNNVEMAGMLYIVDRRQREEKEAKYSMVVLKKDYEGM